MQGIQTLQALPQNRVLSVLRGAETVGLDSVAQKYVTSLL